jgi:hypothetical protein
MTFLMKSADNGNTYTDLVHIKDYPDFLNEVATIDVTDLQNAMHTYIMGLLYNGGDMAFTCNYTKTDYTTLKALAGAEQYLAIWFGGSISGGAVVPSGTDGKWAFKGMVNVGIVGKGVDEAREMQVHVTPTTDMSFT